VITSAEEQVTIMKWLRPHRKKVKGRVVGPTNGIDMQMEGKRNKIHG
jgi:hypothetical protein